MTQARNHYKTMSQSRLARMELAACAVRAFSVTLSFPASELMQNRMSGRHWGYMHTAKVAQRDEAYLLARQAIVSSGFDANRRGRYRVTMEFCPPDARRRDVSNLHAAMKAALDGIAQAMGIDDSVFVEHEQRLGSLHYGGRVAVRVGEIRSLKDCAGG